VTAPTVSTICWPRWIYSPPPTRIPPARSISHWIRVGWRPLAIRQVVARCWAQPADPRIAGYVSMASGAFETSLPTTPSFFMAGTLDAVVTVADRTRPAFDAAPEPKLLWVIDGAGHNAFDDFCTFGNGTGIIGIAEASGLGPLLDAQPQLRTLGEDGCVAPAVPVTTTFPLINHGVTAWLRHLFGVDPTPVGLGAAVSDAYGVAVEVVGAP
jgi:hypothetical protein